MSSSARTRLQVDERRAQLVELGVRLFSERAYDEISIDDIARAAGVSKGLLYHYFGGKRAFYVASVEHAASELISRTEQPDLELGAERARAGLLAYLDFAQEHKLAYRTLMRSGIGNDPEVVAILERARTEIVTRNLRHMGLDAEQRPVFRAALVGWIGQVEASCMDWLERGTPTKEELLLLLLGSLWGVLATAKLIDPEAPFELSTPSPFD